MTSLLELKVIILIAWHLLQWENKHVNIKQLPVEQSTRHDLFQFGSTLELSICAVHKLLISDAVLTDIIK